VKIRGREIGRHQPLFLIAGPCVIESRSSAIEAAEVLREIADRLGLLLVYKSSFDKANRTSGSTFRGPGMEQGLAILAEVREQCGLPVLADIHSPEQARPVSEVVDVLQIPAFLCRQTDLIGAAAATGKPVNIKKGQFLSPEEMVAVAAKAQAAGSEDITVCERGTTFGYNNLVVDMRSLNILERSGCPVVFDATHSVQLPGAGGDRSGGQREFVPVLARAAVAAGISGLFLEVHPEPDKAPSDGPNAWPLNQLEVLLGDLMTLDAVVKGSRSFAT
jgi:2-dehydro-3-deoxyphosphooctonate aldolase (KDO 8-P synthase)